MGTPVYTLSLPPLYAGSSSEDAWTRVGRVKPVSAKRNLHTSLAEDAALMHERGDDRLLDPYVPTKFDEEEWEWE